jgi:serine/threonine protein kinase
MIQLVNKTHCSTIYLDMATDSIKKTAPKELLFNECRVLKDLCGLTGIPNISLQNDSIVMKKYQEFQYKNLDLLQIRKIIKQLGTILSQIHSKGYAHLDLSVENIMQEKHQIILIDFALSKKSDELHHYGCGTPGYIAPEVYTDQKTYTASDMYSLGIVLGQMLDAFLPGLSLHFLGSSLVRHPTTTFICKRIEQILMERDVAWKEILYHAADLVKSLLEYDHCSRMTAQKLLQHPFILAPDDEFTEYKRDFVTIRLFQPPLSSCTKSRSAVVYFRG